MCNDCIVTLFVGLDMYSADPDEKKLKIPNSLEFSGDALSELERNLVFKQLPVDSETSYTLIGD